MKKLLVLFAAFITASSSVLAADFNDKLEIDLKVKGQSQTDWQNNLESNVMTFGPNTKFDVWMIIKNKDSANQTWVDIKTYFPSTVAANSDMSFKIPEIGANSEISKQFTLVVKDKQFVTKGATKNQIYTYAKAESGAVGKDWTYFYTGDGTFEASKSAAKKPILPATGAGLLMVSLIASALTGFGVLARRYSRGY